MTLYQKVKSLRDEYRGVPEKKIVRGILTLLIGDLESEAINSKEYAEKLVELTADMERPEDRKALKTVDGIEYLITFVLVKDNSEITDEKVEAKIRKFIKGNADSIGYGSNQSAQFAEENEFLKTLLPAMMDEATLRQHIADSKATHIGGAMGYLKQFQGLYDGALANRLVREMLASKQ
jgi:hypothetical protein